MRVQIPLSRVVPESTLEAAPDPPGRRFQGLHWNPSERKDKSFHLILNDYKILSVTLSLICRIQNKH